MTSVAALHLNQTIQGGVSLEHFDNIYHNLVHISAHPTMSHRLTAVALFSLCLLFGANRRSVCDVHGEAEMALANVTWQR
jgi:hypothetical protein